MSVRESRGTGDRAWQHRAPPGSPAMRLFVACPGTTTTKLRRTKITTLFFVLLLMIRRGLASSSFDIRDHLSTKAPYAHRVPIPGAPSLHELPDPPGHRLTLLWAVARHGSRWPTAKRLQQMISLQAVFKAADASRHPWLLDWSAPMAGFEYLAGELHATGEAEMFSLAERLRRRFPQLSSASPYAPSRFPIIATQVPRTAQSASAFALSFFARHGDTSSRNGPQQQQQQQRSETQSSRGGRDGCRPWLPQPVAVNMLPKRQDPVLRPFDSCPSYRQHEDRAMRWLAPWMQQHWRSMVPDLEQRLGLPRHSLTPCHVDALWQLCTFEAGLGLRGSTTTTSSSSSSSASNTTSSACDLFSREQVLLLEWLEDVRLNEVQGYGAPINYEIAAPLLADAASALASAAASASAGRAPLQLARLHFAHAETLAPFAALLGLFRPEADSAEAQHMPRLPDEATLRTLTAGVHSTRVEADWAAADSAADDLLPVIMEAEDAAADPPVLGADPAAAAAVVASAAAAEAGSVAAGDGVSAADVQSTEQWDATGVSEHLLLAAAGTAGSLGPGQREQQQQQQQYQRQGSVGTSRSRQPEGQQEAAMSQLRKRRRLAASPPGRTAPGAAAAADGGLEDTAVAAGVIAAARGSSTASDEAERSVAGQLQDSSSSFSSSSGMSGLSSSTTSSSSRVASKHSHGPALEGCSYKGRPLDPGLLLPPPQGWRPALDDDRAWRGGRVAPLGANLLLVLYSRIGKGGAGAGSDHLVRLVYNEQVLSVPGCRPAASGTGYEVTLAEFLRVAVGSKADGRRFRQHCGAGGNGGGGLELLTADGLSIVLPDGAAGGDAGDDGGSSSDLSRQRY